MAQQELEEELQPEEKPIFQKTKPYPYQLAGADFVEECDGRALIADEMGLGKSLQSLLFAEANKTARPIIVVCPAVVKYNWQDEANKHLNMLAEVLNGRTPPKETNTITKMPILILNYEILEGWVSFLKKLKPQLLILDECHRFKNPQAKSSKACRELAKDIPNVIALGGTPLINRPNELWHVLHILRPERFPNYSRFCQRYCRIVYTRWGVQIKGVKSPWHAQQLHRRLKSVMIRRLKKDVIKDLPERNKIVLPVLMKDRKQYDEAKTNFREWMRRTKPVAANRAARSKWKMEQMVKAGYLIRLTAELKIPSVINWIDDYLEENEGKLLLFGHHKNFLHTLQEHYKQCSVLLTGETPTPKRKIVIQQFNKDKKTRLMFGNTLAAGVGWNCTCTSTVAHLELEWTPALHVQASDRCHGIGRGLPGEPLTEYFLVAKDSAEEMLLRVLQYKQNEIDLILDGKKGAADFNVLDKFVRALMEGE